MDRRTLLHRLGRQAAALALAQLFGPARAQGAQHIQRRIIAQRVAMELERSHNLSERKNMENLALRSQRTEALGTLSGGVAHDLNNALAPILMGVELLKMRCPQESKILDMFETSARRGAAA